MKRRGMSRAGKKRNHFDVSLCEEASLRWSKNHEQVSENQNQKYALDSKIRIKFRIENQKSKSDIEINIKHQDENRKYNQD